MNEVAQQDCMADRPPWLEDSGFPVSPPSHAWGYRRGYRRHAPLVPCTASELEAAVRKDSNYWISLSWTPERGHMLPPLEFPSLRQACQTREISMARRTLTWALLSCALLGVALLFLLPVQWSVSRVGHGWVFLLAGLLFLLVQVGESAENLFRAKRFSPADIARLAWERRYGVWFFQQKSQWKYILPVSLLAVALLQSLTPNIFSGQAAALIKPAVLGGEWWRLLTAPFIHANIGHVLGNAVVFFFCAWQVEAVAPRGSVPFITLAGFLCGGILSVLLLPHDSVGASGGTLALLGFLVMFAWKYRSEVPYNFARSMLLAVVLALIAGLVVPRVDNAAHVGGLIAGIGGAQLIFSAPQNRIRLLGRLSAIVLLASFIAVFVRHWYLGAGI